VLVIQIRPSGPLLIRLFSKRFQLEISIGFDQGLNPGDYAAR
jgi:hypothetical protein